MALNIAYDLACRLIQFGIVEALWIHSSDADTLLPSNYFEMAEQIQAERVSTLIYPFRHPAASGEDPALILAQGLYDTSLHYYMTELRWAGSPYTYHSIGRTLCLHYRHYAMARGFQKGLRERTLIS